MIVPSLKLVFVHVPKTAGQSIERALCDRIGVEWEDRRKIPELVLSNRPEDARQPLKLSHLAAREYVEFGYLSELEWDQYSSFGVVRNPWQRLVSSYVHLRLPYVVSFRAWVRQLPAHGTDKVGIQTRSQVDYLFDKNGNKLVDEILQFETLKTDWQPISERFGLEPVLPRINVAKKRWRRSSPNDLIRIARRRGTTAAMNFARHSRSHWRDYYDVSTERLVGQLYAEDVDAFDYAFES